MLLAIGDELVRSLPMHWDEAVRKRHAPPGQLHAPPEEPHSPYYPARGLYSSRDNATLHAQFASLAAAGVDTAMLSWWGRKDSDVRRDSQGVNTDLIVPAVLDAAAAHGVGISWHLEPYGGRSPQTVLEDNAPPPWKTHPYHYHQ